MVSRASPSTGAATTFSASGTAAPPSAAFQLTAEGIADNRYAARWFAEQGFPNPVVIGHSNGGMLLPGWWYVITAESFLDRMTEMPDVLELAPTIRCPTLFIRGDQEDPDTSTPPKLSESTPVAPATSSAAGSRAP